MVHKISEHPLNKKITRYQLLFEQMLNFQIVFFVMSTHLKTYFRLFIIYKNKDSLEALFIFLYYNDKRKT